MHTRISQRNLFSWQVERGLRGVPEQTDRPGAKQSGRGVWKQPLMPESLGNMVSYKQKTPGHLDLRITLYNFALVPGETVT